MSESETYFNRRGLQSQNSANGNGASYLSDDDAKQALAMKRKGVLVKYIAVRFNVSSNTIAKYIKRAEQLEEDSNATI